jgi:protein PhnA
MSVRPDLILRSENKCELCGSIEDLQEHLVAPRDGGHQDDYLVACAKCISQLENQDAIDINHWRCLNDCMWSTVPAVQVTSFRMLHRLNSEGWARDLLGMMYMDEETAKWANTGLGQEEVAIVHKDSNGHVLEAGDTVVLIKDLNVKGANFTAKRGTAVRRIRLVQDNAGQIEGKVDGQQIVILTQYVKKSS